MKRFLSFAAFFALPLLFTNCATTADPIGEGIEDVDRAIEEHLPGLGPNIATQEVESLR